MKYAFIIALLVFAAFPSQARLCSPCDIDGDGLRSSVHDDYAFQVALGSREGSAKFNPRADFDGDKAVTVSDFGIYLKWCK